MAEQDTTTTAAASASSQRTDDAPVSTKASGVTSNIAVSPPPTFIDAVIESILTPGASSGLVATINAALIGLLFVLAWWAFMEGGVTIHTGLLAFFAVGLLSSFNWFLSLMRSAEEAKEEALEAAGESNKTNSSAGTGIALSSSGSADSVRQRRT